MRQYEGFILIIVLLFLQVTTLLGLYALEECWIENKQVQNYAGNFRSIDYYYVVKPQGR